MEIVKGKIYQEFPVHNNVRESFKAAIKKYADRIAFQWRPVLTDKTPTTITYREVERDFDALQLALYDPEIKDRRIAIVGVNSYHWSLSYLAAVSGLGIAVPLDPLLTPTEIVNLLQRGEVDTIICDARFVSLLEPYFKDLSFIKHRICMLKERETGKKQVELEKAMDTLDFQNFDELLARGKEAYEKGNRYDVPEILPDTDVALLFTSGTTSESKGVIISHYNITSNISGMQRFLVLPEAFHYLSILPLHHCLENTCGLHSVLAYGGCICYCDGLRYINQNLEEYKPHLLIGVPALYDSFQKKILIGVKKLNKEKIFHRARKISKFLLRLGIDLRRKLFKDILAQFGGNLTYCISGAAHQRVEVIKFMQELGVEIIQGYGLTECAPVVAGCNSQFNPIGTCGFALGGLEIAIDNDYPGEDGEILVRVGTFPNHRPGWNKQGPNKMTDNDLHITMKGYYKNQEATNEIFKKEGWLRTMDIGHIDPKTKGLVLTGRAKSMIVLNSGKKVFPEEIESLINGIDMVADSLVWAEPIHDELQLIARLALDQEFLETYKKEKESQGLTKEEILSSIEDKLTKELESINANMIKFKRIRHFYFSNKDMIKTTTRKIKRKPEIAHIHEFFKAKGHEGIDYSVKNLDSIGFDTFANE